MQFWKRSIIFCFANLTSSLLVFTVDTCIIHTMILVDVRINQMYKLIFKRNEFNDTFIINKQY